MRSTINGAPSFSYVHIDLSPKESVLAESGAMQSMSADIDIKAQTNGGFFSALAKSLFGGESFFVNKFTNNSESEKRVTISQGCPGEIVCTELSGNTIYLQKGAYIASTAGVKVSASWAGFASFFGGQGLFRLKARGTGTLWYGGYGAILTKDLDGDIIVDGGFLLGYEGDIKISVTLPGGIIASLTGGEGLVSRLKGKGKVYIQTRSISGLAAWLNPQFR